MNARVLDMRSDIDAIAELERMGLPAGEATIRAASLRQCVLKIDRLPAEAVAGAAVRVEVIAGPAKDGSAPLLLIGTCDKLMSALQALKQRPDCVALADEAESALLRSLSPPAVPTDPDLDPRLQRLSEAIGERTLIMGILNVTPDSFSDGGRFSGRAAAVERALQMAEEGADILDIGGESTRPGAVPVSVEEEIDRVVPVISEVSRALELPISIDTYKAKVAEAALAHGAAFVNDVSAASWDPAMPVLLAEVGCPAVLMHMRGTPRDMQTNTSYDDLMGEVCGYLASRVDALVAAGVDERMLIVDPGIGFAKTAAQNLEILRRLREFKCLGRPILVGASRKYTIGKVLGNLPPEERMEGTAATVALSIAGGASIVRVHDVKQMARVARMTDAILHPHADL